MLSLLSSTLFLASLKDNNGMAWEGRPAQIVESLKEIAALPGGDVDPSDLCAAFARLCAEKPSDNYAVANPIPRGMSEDEANEAYRRALANRRMTCGDICVAMQRAGCPTGGDPKKAIRWFKSQVEVWSEYSPDDVTARQTAMAATAKREMEELARL